jgi:hypothetical protein
MAELVSYILAQTGRITADLGGGKYDYEPISPDDIIDRLDPSAIFNPDPEDGSSIFFEILEVSGLWTPQQVEDDLSKNDEISDDDLKN